MHVWMVMLHVLRLVGLGVAVLWYVFLISVGYVVGVAETACAQLRAECRGRIESPVW